MNQKYYILFCMLVGLGACKRETRPPGVLSPDEFSKVLVEVYLAEARINSTVMQRDSAIKLFIPYEEKLFQQLGLPDSVMRKTYQYYVDNPKMLEKIYDSVIDTLNLREKKLRAKSGSKPTEKENRISKPENKP